MATLLDKPRISPLALKDWDQGLKQSSWIKPDAEDKKDLPATMAKVFNVTATVANHPNLAKNWNKFAMHIMGTNSLSPRLREIVILRMGYLCESDYELSQHAWIGELSGLSKQEIKNIIVGPFAEGWSTLEALVIQAVDELKVTNIIATDTWNGLKENGLKQQELMDLVFTAGQYNLVSWALNSFGVQLDEGLESFLDNLE